MRKIALLVLILGAGCVVDRRGPETHCPVHQQALQVDTVDIVYGLVGHTQEELVAMEKTFPFSNTVFFGGCMVSCCSPSYAEVLYCPRCRQAKSSWDAKYR